MQTVWFPVPVAALFRRIVNVVSTVSIAHHYIHQSTPDAPHPYALRWPAWLSKGTRGISSANRLDSYIPQSDANTDIHRNAYSDHRVDLPEVKEPPHQTPSPDSCTSDQIHLLINNPALYDPLRRPRYPIVLCHGLYGFDVRGPSAFPILQQHYWSNVLNVLRRKVGAEVLVTGVPSTGSVSSRAENLDRFLRERAPARGVNFLAHSMGGLDCRYLITHIKPEDYVPLSLTTIATPHRGSPFMDWCRQYLGLGRHQTGLLGAHMSDAEAAAEAQDPPPQDEKQTPSVKSLLSIASLPSSFTTLLLSLLDSPAYAHLTSTYLNTVFNPNTPDDPTVKYFSVAGRVSGMNIWHPLWLPKMVLDGFEERERARLRESGHPIAHLDSEWGNDGLVTVQSARWGEFLGVLEGCDHWEIRGARGLDVDLPSIPGAETWNLADWSKFVRAWKREEKEAAKSAGAGISEQRHMLATVGASLDEGDGARQADSRRGRDRESMNADEVVKSSTDKMSAVFDWIIDSVPSPLTPGSKGEASRESERAKKKERAKSTRPAERNDLATKMDLERFYVALCRKLYDEGL
ncbi:Alpha/Beta hydrolase protein [Daedaleopsis nitida]|nr:Alpha/Beta hydrolase protein [Daedaleopsis nitida]